MNKPDGKVQIVACGAVIQPPYAVRIKGRWYRTVAASYMTDTIREQVETLPSIGSTADLYANLNRTRRQFSDLPLWPIGTTEDDHGKPSGFDQWLSDKRKLDRQL